MKRSLPVNILLFLLTQAAVAGVYFAVGRLGLYLAFKNINISPIWPPTGLALALVIRCGYRCAVGIWFGALLIAISVGAPLIAGCSIGAGNALEAIVGCFLLRSMLGGEITSLFSKTWSTAAFLIVGVLLCTTISASVGVASLCAVGKAAWSSFAGLWTIWWVGDAVGALLVTPVLLTWSNASELRTISSRLAEACLLTVVSTSVAYAVFCIGDSNDAGEHAQVALIIPILVWSILRFGVLGFTFIHMLVAGIAVWGTVSGHGPFYRDEVHHSLMVLQGNIVIVGSTLLLMSVLVEERKNVESQFRRIQSELTRASRLRLVGETAAGVAHELNQPLVAITNLASGCQIRVKRGSLSQDELAEALESIKASAMQASERTERIRAFIQDRELRKSQTAINLLVHDAVAFVRSDAERHSITVDVLETKPLPTVYIDDIQISQVLVNLLVNSIQSIAESQTKQRWIRVALQQDSADEISITVTDSGPGISQEDMPHVFDQFYTTKSDGLGMGLAISRSVIEMHGGQLTLNSTSENHIQFRIKLPLRPIEEP